MPVPLMGAEAFSYVLERAPGAMAFIGGCPPELEPGTAPGNHSNLVRFDEDALPNGVALYAQMALKALARPAPTQAAPPPRQMAPHPPPPPPPPSALGGLESGDLTHPPRPAATLVRGD